MFESRPLVPSLLDALPSTVEDLAGWEPVALHDFLGLARLRMVWAVERAMPTVEMVTAALSLRHPGSVRPPNGEVAELAPGVATNILLLRGHVRLDGLWHLHRWCVDAAYLRASGHDPAFFWSGPRPSQLPDTVEGLLGWHQRGFTEAMLAGLGQRGLPPEFAVTWTDTFSSDDLLLGMDARLSGPELVDVLVGGLFPDRDGLRMMAALRLNTARV